MGNKKDSIEELRKNLQTLKKLGENSAKLLEKVKKEWTESYLQKLTEEALENKGYDISPQPQMEYGIPDIIAIKKEKEIVTEYLTIEIKGINDPLGQKLNRYYIGETLRVAPALVKKKFILVLPVFDGEEFDIWGLKQILSAS
jgi:hypothetical protein